MSTKSNIVKQLILIKISIEINGNIIRLFNSRWQTVVINTKKKTATSYK